MEHNTALILGNLATCLFGGWVCICRMGMMSGPTTKPAVRLQYIMLFLLFVVSGISWLFGDPATWTQWTMGAIVIAHLVTGWGAWKYGAPYYTRRVQ